MSFAYNPPPPSGAAPLAGGGGGGGASNSSTSIAQLVQGLQSGHISKQQLYASLTSMYKGGGPTNFQLASPAPATPLSNNSSLNLTASFSLNTTTPQQTTPMTNTQHLHQLQSQYPPPASSFAPPSSFAPSSSLAPSSSASSSQPYSAAQAAAAQQHIQSFLSKRFNTANDSTLHHSLSDSLNLSESLQLSLDQSRNGLDSSINLTHASMTQHQQHQQQQHLHANSFLHPALHPSIHGTPMSQVGGAAGNVPVSLFSPALNHNDHNGRSYSSNMSGLESFTGHDINLSASALNESQQSIFPSSMNQSFASTQLPYDHQQQQQQHQHHTPYQSHYPSHMSDHGSMSHLGDDPDEEAVEYIAGSGHRYGDGVTSLRPGSQDSSNTHSNSQRRGSGTARQSVRERMAQVYTDEKNKELTFKPTIAPLPKGLYHTNKSSRLHGGDDDDSESQVPFLGRVMHWHENKRARERQRAADVDKQVMSNCTFKPKINEESIAIVEAPGASQRRLFSARSTARAKILELELKRKEEEAFRTACTFEPKLNRSSLAMASSLAVRRPLTETYDTKHCQELQSSATAAAQQAALAECTFAPRVNRVAPTMQSATLYLSQDPFERLAADAVNQQQRKREKMAAGYDSDTTSSNTHRRGRHRSKSDSKSKSPTRSVSQSRGGNGGTDSQFDEFLARLKYTDFQRKERLEQLKAEEQKEFQYGRPMLSKKSAKLVKKAIEEGRYLPPSIASPNHKAITVGTSGENGTMTTLGSPRRGAPVNPIDAVCTFTPAINPYSASLPRRSPEAMSQLEMIRRQQNLSIAATERLSEEMAEVSFQPHLITSSSKASKPFHHIDGRLGILTEPDQYSERIEFQRRIRQAEIERQKKLREEAELKECTFVPSVHEAPQFVKRIAEAVHKTKEQKRRSESKKKVKQDWR